MVRGKGETGNRKVMKERKEEANLEERKIEEKIRRERGRRERKKIKTGSW